MSPAFRAFQSRRSGYLRLPAGVADRNIPIDNPWRELTRDAVLVVAIVSFARRLIPAAAPYWIGSIAEQRQFTYDYPIS